ncbi:hypothetical protein EXU85_30175 [Spirosoma sp. KCTC 42546]|uniref:HAD hydrolase family protein n=1 Tax=Spirosoma sp. KCTC 42546 TaxID=2520506 RepID=UPI0011588B72|nr:HAD hydrolase family protein [Spirosoma sp. KCTC 42546]QDK82647.1 hypothetical protein EXU85_30175 [Spirosoma sp. KCTC 42546]
MGKPFKKELTKINSTIEWALIQESNILQSLINDPNRKPLYIVGSGGSLSACFYLETIYQKLGGFAKAITPLELYSLKESIKGSNIIFISASGKNNDILFSFELSIQRNPNQILTISMSEDSPLSRLANSYSISKSINFPIPSKKDGFLATNSLLAYFIILCKSINKDSSLIEIQHINYEYYKRDLNNFMPKIKENFTLFVLYGGWGKSVAYDIESKFTEAALGNVILSDYRNFGHGRHHWFAKKGNNSAIISLITPEEELLQLKTINLLPPEIPTLEIKSNNTDASSTIELLVKSFLLADAFGDLQNIDPGRPGVPDFGSKLYHLKYAKIYNTPISDEQTAILKKNNKSDISQFDISELKFWKEKYVNFKNKINSIQFYSIVFDYDGTLCSETEKKIGPCQEIIKYLINFLENGIIIGIASGRGKSVKIDLRRAIPEKYWNNVIIGYYNGSELGLLGDNNTPNVQLEINEDLQKVFDRLEIIEIISKNTKMTLRPYQLTIELNDTKDTVYVKNFIQNFVLPYDNLLFLISSHSIDIVVKGKSSKVRVVDKCNEISLERNGINNCLTIGDKGVWPGNDYALLGLPYSLSVDEVSPDPDTCWNLCQIGLKNIPATINYLNKISFKKNHFMIKL